MSAPQKPADIRAAATALGKLGASKGGRARAKNMPPEERSRQARHAVSARWRRLRQSAATGGTMPPGAAPR
jgi:hypothetical protein